MSNLSAIVAAAPPISTEIPQAAGDGATGTATSGNPAATGGGATGAGSASRGWDPFLPIVLIMVVGLVLMTVFGQRRERKKREAMLSTVKKHDRVQTIGGVIGSVVDIKPDHVVLKVDEASNTRITFSRSAIQQVLTSSPE